MADYNGWAKNSLALKHSAATAETRGRPAPDADQWYNAIGDIVSAAGVEVSADTAAKCIVFYGCLRILSRDRPSLPCFLFQDVPGGRQKAKWKRAYHIIHEQPNPYMTAMEWGRAVEWSMGLRGNQYNYLDWDRAGELQGIYPLPTDKVTPEIVDGQVVYDVYIDGEKRRYGSWQILHFRDVTEDGIMGISPIKQAASTLGLAIAADQYASDFFKNDATPGGYLEHPDKLSDKAHANLRKSHQAAHKGGGRHHVMGILEEGMKWNSVQISPEDVQCLATRAFQRELIAGCVCGIPVQKLGSTDDASYNNTENFRLEYVTDCVRPMCVAREQRMNMTLLTQQERDEGYYFEHCVEALLRGDMASQANYWKALFYVGGLTPNEIRQHINKVSIDGGDDLFVPANVRPLSVPYTPPTGSMKNEEFSSEKDEE